MRLISRHWQYPVSLYGTAVAKRKALRMEGFSANLYMALSYLILGE
tara:strand:+ start:122 stop:259 length:138 start_codon:yes stop_codon:yes gene_type:complete